MAEEQDALLGQSGLVGHGRQDEGTRPPQSRGNGAGTRTVSRERGGWACVGGPGRFSVNGLTQGGWRCRATEACAW